MPITDQALWGRIAAYDFGRVAGVSLAERVEKETALSAVQARMAVVEYRRFLYLAVIGQTPTIPSPVVDAVWHRHILDTRNYVDEFCGKVVGRMIHHNPGRPAAKKDPDYPATLVRYQEEFGPPPPKVWPSSRLQNSEIPVAICFAAGIVALIIGFSIESWQVVLSGVALTVLPVVWWLRYGPWATGKSGDGGGGCGSGGDGGGCGGE